jgi:hypothetical protein
LPWLTALEKPAAVNLAGKHVSHLSSKISGKLSLDEGPGNVRIRSATVFEPLGSDHYKPAQVIAVGRSL